jgi:hypothetical protein
MVVLPDTLTVDPGGTTTSALVRTNRQMVSTIGEMVPSGVGFSELASRSQNE